MHLLANVVNDVAISKDDCHNADQDKGNGKSRHLVIELLGCLQVLGLRCLDPSGAST
jgi:hypothetical protein